MRSSRSLSPQRSRFFLMLALATIGGIPLIAGGKAAWSRRQETSLLPEPLSTGRRIAPQGRQTEVGSFPVNMALSPDGKFIAVTNTGYRQFLSILSADDGHLVSQMPFNPAPGNRADNTSLYYGLAFQPKTADGYHLYVSRGPEDRISGVFVTSEGKLGGVVDTIENPSTLPAAARSAQPNFVAGIAGGNGRLYAANNESSAYTDFKGSVSVFDSGTQTPARLVAHIPTPGFPLAIVAVTKGPDADKKLYVSSEQDGCVAVLDVQDARNGRNIKDIKTGDHPTGLLLNTDQSRLFVANSGSDTVSEIDTEKDAVVRTWKLRGKSKLPGVTPLGLALSPDETRLYATLADQNALAVIDLKSGKNEPMGMIPTGWYPTSVLVSSDGRRLFVANAKGARTRNPNNVPSDKTKDERYIENIIEGTVSMLPTPSDAELGSLTQMVMRLNPPPTKQKLPDTGITHVIYIIKENRTYDEVLGDMPQGNGDKSLVLFGRDVTPNQHALAERFVLLDNFYCSAEVSADGWNWTISGMSSEYNARNVPFNYSGRGRSYDFEGEINGTPVDLLNKPDVNRAPGGYIWDAVAKKGLSYRNYGFYTAFSDAKTLKGELITKNNTPVKKVLVGHTDVDFRGFDMAYPDSDAPAIHHAVLPPQISKYGAFDSPSRFAEWKREFAEYVRTNSLPRFSMIRFPRDHTVGTRPGVSTPRALVADNDYAVGQLVEAVSKSQFWKNTAIFVLEDDAQDGIDHVDAHRSTAFVISPYVQKGMTDHHFYNSDSTLHTMELLLGLPPMCQYDAIAPVFAAFGSTPANDAPYTAILPSRSVIAERNGQQAYRARESAKLDFAHADRVPDHIMRDLIWHSVKGANTPLPPLHHALPTSAQTNAQRHDEDDDD